MENVSAANQSYTVKGKNIISGVGMNVSAANQSYTVKGKNIISSVGMNVSAANQSYTVKGKNIISSVIIEAVPFHHHFGGMLVFLFEQF